MPKTTTSETATAAEKTERQEQRAAARPLLAAIEAAAKAQGGEAKPSNTERGHQPRTRGNTAKTEIGPFLVGVDLWEEARGGTKTTKRNRVLTPCGAYFRNTKSGRRNAAIWALTNARHKRNPEKHGLLSLSSAW